VGNTELINERRLRVNTDEQESPANRLPNDMAHPRPQMGVRCESKTQKKTLSTRPPLLEMTHFATLGCGSLAIAGTG
jgi:hypothetical protein